MAGPSASTSRPSSTWSIATPTHRRDLLLVQEHAQQRLAVRQPADAEVPEERLRGDVGQLDLLLQPGLAQLVGDVEEELVGRAEAAGTLGGADHDVAGVGRGSAASLPGVDGVLEGGDGEGVAVGAEAGDHVDLVAVAGGDDQVVVGVGAAGGLDRPASGSIAVAAAWTNSTPWARTVGATGKVMSAGVRLPNGSQISDGLNTNWSEARSR